MIDISLKGIGELLTSTREAITGKKIVNEVEMKELDLKLNELSQAIALGQIGINKEEAKHSSIFVAGWRPFIGWVCGSALVFNFIISPLLLWFCLIAKFDIPTPPALDTQSLITLLLGLLGLGGMRTYEKLKNVESNR